MADDHVRPIIGHHWRHETELLDGIRELIDLTRSVLCSAAKTRRSCNSVGGSTAPPNHRPKSRKAQLASLRPRTSRLEHDLGIDRRARHLRLTGWCETSRTAAAYVQRCGQKRLGPDDVRDPCQIVGQDRKRIRIIFITGNGDIPMSDVFQ
jgi:hypothetical protein